LKRRRILPMTESAVSAAATPPARQLPFFVALGWGMGTLGPAMVLAATNVLLLRFMTDHLGIAAAMAGLLLAASKIYDAVTDPLTGILTDRTKSRIGRRRPWLLWGGLALALVFVALFNPPSFASPQATTLYMGAMLLLYATAYSTFSIPYMAMPAEMTRNYHERSYLMTFRVFAAAAGGIAATSLGTWLIARYGGGALGHGLMAWTLAPLVLLSALWAYRATEGAPFTARAMPKERFPLHDQIRLIVENRPFLVLLIVKFATLMILGVQAAFPFFFAQVLAVKDDQLAAYFLAQQVSMLLSQFLWLFLARRLGKKLTLQIALFVLIFIGLTWLLAAAGDPFWQVLLRAIGTGVASGGVLLMGQALLPDTQEYDYLLSGLRREGLFAALYTTVEKASGAVGVAVVGWFLGFMGYVAGGGGLAAQSESAILGIRLSVGLFTPLCCGLAFLALLFYNLPESRLKRLRAERSAAEAA
jgi:GPH family glycoside/pentoside/hexuronide:cation symporter